MACPCVDDHPPAANSSQRPEPGKVPYPRKQPSSGSHKSISSHPRCRPDIHRRDFHPPLSPAPALTSVRVRRGVRIDKESRRPIVRGTITPRLDANEQLLIPRRGARRKAREHHREASYPYRPSAPRQRPCRPQTHEGRAATGTSGDFSPVSKSGTVTAPLLRLAMIRCRLGWNDIAPAPGHTSSERIALFVTSQILQVRYAGYPVTVA